MFDDRHYVPILKWRRGEQWALRDLADTTRTQLTPLIEIPPIQWDYNNDAPTKTLDEHIQGFAESLSSYWGNRPAFVDLPWCHDERVADGRLAVEAVFDDCATHEQPAIPVTTITRDRDYQTVVRAVAARDGLGVCVRVEPEDWEDPTSLNNQLELLLQELKLSPEQCDLLIDLKSVERIPVGTVTMVASSLLTTIDHIGEWRTVILAGGSFPENLTGIDPNVIARIDRTEWQAWVKIRQGLSNARIPTFADYAIAHPEPADIDPRIMRMSANLRYTIPDGWLFLKGQNVRQHGHEQFNALCKKMVRLPEYSGPDFSWGDQYIDLCARDEDGPGNATTWRRVGVSHHLAFVTHDLSTLSAP